MKKQYIVSVVVIFIGCVLVKTLKPNQWDVFVYSLCALFLLLNAGQELFIILRTRNGIYVYGYIKEVNAAEENDEIIEVIEFVSPIDNETYHIESISKGVFDLSNQLSGRVKVWVNVKNPKKSLVTKKIDSLILLSLFGKLIVAIFFGVMIVLNW